MKNCPTCQASYPTNFAVCPQDGTALVEVGTWGEGTVIRGKYRILNRVGQGGMGTVYKALHVAFDELRALKVINPGMMNDELFVKRFQHEAVITRKLQHPNAVRVEDIDEAEDGRPFIVMEYIEGQSLKKLIQEQGALPVPRVCSIVKQVAAALEASHQLGMVHRDVKPENIVLIETSPGEQVKVLDFGIAKIKEARAKETSSMTLTGTGVVIGTPQYMSPEQAMGKRGDQLDGRSDIYSLGIVMYQMLTGELPYKADTTMAMLLAHLQTPPTPIRQLRPELQISEAVAGVVMRTLEKSPEMRPSSAQALIQEIERAEKAPVSLGATHVATPGSVYSPQAAAQALREALRASAMDVAKSPPAARPAAPAKIPSLAPLEPPPSPRAVPARAPVVPSPQPVPAFVTAPPRKSRWGLWASVGVLAIALGGAAGFLLRQPTSVVPNVQSPTSPPATSLATPSGQGSTIESQGQNPTSAQENPAPVPSAAEAASAQPGSRPFLEITKVILHGRVAEVLGRTEPGSTVIINNEQVFAISFNGRFRHLTAPFPRPGTSQITITARNRKGDTNTIRKSIVIEHQNASAAPVEQPAPAPSVDTKPVKAALAMGDLYYDRGDYDNAIREYQRGLAADPSNRILRSKIEAAQKAKAAEQRILQGGPQ